jgi:hypothetical protein
LDAGMTYWNREHEQNLRRIRDMNLELALIADETIPSLMSDLREDDFDATEDSRARLREARTAINNAIGLLENAKDQLPEPRYPQRFKQLHPTAQDVMEREG